MDYVEIGPAPYEEWCAQVGDENYSIASRRECSVFAKQIARHYPPPEGIKISIKSNRHDFGTYREVVISGPQEWMMRVESDKLGVLANWDEDAMHELGIERIKLNSL